MIDRRCPDISLRSWLISSKIKSWMPTPRKITSAISLPAAQATAAAVGLLRRAPSQGEEDACDTRGLGCSRLRMQVLVCELGEKRPL